jgi:hypothetical protein
VLLAALAIAPLAAAPTAPPKIPLVRDGRAACVIVFSSGDPLVARTARKLSDYLREQTDATVTAVPDQPPATVSADTTLIVLDGTPDQRVVARHDASQPIHSDRVDAYQLRTVRSSARGALVLAAGRSAAGVKYATYRLMQELEISGRSAELRPLSIQASPFLRTRSVSLFNIWSMPITLTRRHNTESWSVEALERYVDLYDQFGFNAIESHDRFNDNYLEPLFGLTRADWRNKVLRMCDRAHANGQQFFLRIWGHNVMDTPKFTQPLGPTAAVPRTMAYLCVNDPAERRRWDEEILQYYVRHYAGRIDHLIGHWCDPGVCRRNGCDFRTPQRLQMELHRAFKQVDPNFSSTFSLWFFDVTKKNRAGWARGGWAGYESDLDLINAGILAPEVDIATATTLPGSYQDNIVQAILAAGHRPAVWTWYRADHEIRPSLHIHLHERLGDYFRGLPASARQLAWHNVERNVHGAANTANYYVAGRLMWDPAQEVEALLREFLVLSFGAANAPRLLPAYLAIERIRCHSCFKNWESARHTGVGTADPRADLRLAREALDHLEQVRIDPHFRRRLPLDVAPAQILEDLRASLTVIRDFAHCRAEEMPAIERAVAARDSTTASHTLDALETRFGEWTHTLAGRQEWSLLSAFIRDQRQRLGTVGKPTSARP